jgi:hypothetical protein
MSGFGLGFADDPPAADTPHRALNAEPAPGEDIRAAEGGRLAEPEASEGEDEHECAVSLGPPVATQLVG